MDNKNSIIYGQLNFLLHWLLVNERGIAHLDITLKLIEDKIIRKLFADGYVTYNNGLSAVREGEPQELNSATKIKITLEGEIFINNGGYREEKSLTDLPNPKTKDVKGFVNFKLEKSALNNIADVLDTLHTNTLVSEKVKLPQFKKAFNGSSVTAKMEWIGTTAALSFFIREVSKLSQNKGYKWKIALQCFFIAGKELSTKKLANNKTVSSKDKKIIMKTIRQFQ